MNEWLTCYIAVCYCLTATFFTWYWHGKYLIAHRYGKEINRILTDLIEGLKSDREAAIEAEKVNT